MIKEFDLCPFRRKFWVSVNSSFKELQEKFMFDFKKLGYDEITEPVFDKWNNKGLAFTIRVREKNSGCSGYIIITLESSNGLDKDDEEDFYHLITHEAGHVCDMLLDDINCELIDTEIHSHISGYVAGKLMLTWKNANYGKENESQSVAE